MVSAIGSLTSLLLLEAALGVLRDGLQPGWGLGVLAVPLVAGWVIQVLVGSATYLVPGVAVAEPTARADAREHLGRASLARLTAWNVGVGASWLGLATGAFPVALAGVGLFSLAAMASVVLLLAALARACTSR